MKVKVIKSFLNIPVGSIGEVIKITDPNSPTSSCELKFDCKDGTVLIQYPFDPFCVEVI